MTRLLEAIPMVMLTAFYAYVVWTLTIQVGFSRLPPEGQGLVVTMVLGIMGAFLYMTSETRKRLALLLVSSPFLYFGLLLLRVFLRF